MDKNTRKLYELKAEVFRAVAHPLRLAVIDFLKDGEQCVCDIARHIGAQRSNVSRHLAVMLKAGVVEHRKDGLRMIYSLKAPCILNFLSCVTDLLRRRMEQNRAALKGLK
ncbi:MAG: winged helix-turn-helix transcriptional regulator [Planctomycetes bacterium]|nr:winged helix-turn-helix transcriptional regulator [Planctomycetota bacterium]